MNANQLFETWQLIYFSDLLRYLIPTSIAFLTFWVIGRNRWRHLFIQGSFPKNAQLVREFAYSMSTVAIFATIGFGLYLSVNAGITQAYKRISDYGVFYLVFSFVLTVLFHDFYFYWTHRFMHHKKIFKYVHRVHHESTNPSPWAAYAFHPWEAVIQALVFPIMVFTLPLHRIVMTLFLLYMIVRNVVGHLGFEIFPKGWTKNKWLSWTTAVTHHNIHHEKFNTNYGLYFSWWDRWMKTEDKGYQQRFDEVTSRPKMSGHKAKTSAITIFIIFLGSLLLANAQSVEGKWTTYSEETGSALSVIEIVKVNNSIEGKVAEIFLEPFQGDDPVCTKCSGERKDKKVINMNFLWGFKKNGDKWTGGKILDPQNGESYNSTLWLEGNNTLKVRGYGGVLDLFYRTQTWKRIGTSQTSSPAGVWNTIDDTWNAVKSEVEIVERNGELFGYIRKIYLLPHEGKDPVCIACEGELKGAKIVGMTILNKFKQNGENWEYGEILDPGNGKVYHAAMWLVNDDELQVRGYLGLFYRTQTWRRVKPTTTPFDPVEMPPSLPITNNGATSGAASALIKVNAGRTATIFRYGSDRVLKLYRPAFSTEAINDEYRIGLLLNGVGLDVPQTYEVVELDGAGGVVFEYIPGRSMLQHLASNPWKVLWYAMRMAHLHRNIHSTPIAVDNVLHALKASLADKISRVTLLTSNERASIIARLGTLRDGTAICHGDFHPDNIIMAKGRLVTVDWLTARIGNPLADVARTWLLLTMGTLPENKSAFELFLATHLRASFCSSYLRAYKKLSDFDPDELEEWKLPVAAARLIENVSDQENQNLLHFIRTRVGKQN